MAFTGKIGAGWFLDGSGGPFQKGVVIAVENGIVVSVKPGRSENRTPGELDGEADIDLGKFTVIPALIDCHVHLFMSGTSDIRARRHQLTASHEEIKPVIERHVGQHLRHGVVAIRDGGDWAGHAHRYKHERSTRNDSPPWIMSCHKAFRASGRYGRLIGRPPKPGESLAGAITRVLKKKHADRPDHIKLVNSGINSLKTFGKQTPAQFEQREFSQAVGAVRQFRLPVMVHANGELPVKIAVAAGCASIEHGFFMGRDNLKRMADHGTVWVPTARTMEGYREQLDVGSPEAVIAEKYLNHQVEQIAMAREMGVTMAVGTDSGSLGVHHGAAVSGEIRLFTLAGFSLAEAISGATLQAARLLGLNRLGELRAGKIAAFLAFSCGPKELIQKIHAPDMVFWEGQLLYKKEPCPTARNEIF